MSASQTRLALKEPPATLSDALDHAPHLITEHLLEQPTFPKTVFGFMPDGGIMWLSTDGAITMEFLDRARDKFLTYDVVSYLYVRHTTMTGRLPRPHQLEVFYTLAANTEEAAVSYLHVVRPREGVASLTAHPAYRFPLHSGDGPPIAWLLNPELPLMPAAVRCPSTLA